ncbi:hypothetical protein SNEBB_010339 [Seison nebaliae]|nr:hypothetical protein SNEBB_010339 [Seison nebaliae]KAI3380967.1 hypothetical protein SNEBB_010339 [Seison nebaliae]
MTMGEKAEVCLTQLSAERRKALAKVAQDLVSDGRGLLAADESTGTIGKRFADVGLENVEDRRQNYRCTIFGTPNISSSISGVILYDETIRQKDLKGRPMWELLKEQKLIPGIKVDKGVVTLLGTNNESTTQGLDDLLKRCSEYYELGARFAKWRCVLKIGKNGECPSELAMYENANVLARYASTCQQAGIVPIVEPEVLADGTHTLDDCRRASERVFSIVYTALERHNVYLEGTLLKPNMITSGIQCEIQATPEEVAHATITTLKRTVPAAVAGIVFLSGGQSERKATQNLNAMNRKGQLQTPWPLSFSYGRALQKTAIQQWKESKEMEGFVETQKAMSARAMECHQAALGIYKDEDSQAGDASLFVANHMY